LSKKFKVLKKFQKNSVCTIVYGSSGLQFKQGGKALVEVGRNEKFIYSVLNNLKALRRKALIGF